MPTSRPVLHRLRAHARRTVIFANDYTAAPYTAISDGEVREADLIHLILNGDLPSEDDETAEQATPIAAKTTQARDAIMTEVVAGVRASATPIPLEALADRAIRALGHEKTVATGWAGAGSFRELLRQHLPAEVRLTAEAPYLAFDPKRHGENGKGAALEASDPIPEITVGPAPQIAPPPLPAEPAPAAQLAPPAPQQAPARSAIPAALQRAAEKILPGRAAVTAAAAPQQAAPTLQPAPMLQPAPILQAAPPVQPPQQMQPSAPQPASATASAAVQQSIARIQEACQAPPLAPHEYRLLFEVMAKEITDNDLIGAQTLANITQRAQERGLDVRRDDVRFILEVVSEADPWFEQGASANLFAGRFRNFVVARCRGQGINLSADELDLIDAWFAGGTMPQQQAAQPPSGRISPPALAPQVQSAPALSPAPSAAASRWWSLDDGRPHTTEPPRVAQGVGQPGSGGGAEEFPRIVRTRLRS